LVTVVALVALGNRPVVVEVASVQAASAGRAPALLNASGYVTPRRRATVAAKITGRVEQVFAEEGMIVAEGDVLATLDDSEARKQLAAARAQRDATAAAIADLEVQLGNAERELARQLDLQKQEVASVQALDLARTMAESLRAKIALTHEQVKAADASIAIADQALDNCTVRAPFAGVIVSKDAQRGEMVSPISAGGGFTRTGIATIVDMASLEIEVDVNESYIARVRPGQVVDATLDAYPDWRIPAKVRTVIPTADRQKATVRVRITFDQLDPKMLPDMGVKVAFLPDQTAVEVQSAPTAFVARAAVRSDGDRKVVFIVKDGVLERRAIKAGSERSGMVEILAGLGGGETVVVGGSDELRDGAKVRIKK
jgi:RND family efflux transporter MFP subunit